MWTPGSLAAKTYLTSNPCLKDLVGAFKAYLERALHAKDYKVPAGAHEALAVWPKNPLYLTERENKANWRISF